MPIYSLVVAISIIVVVPIFNASVLDIPGSALLSVVVMDKTPDVRSMKKSFTFV